MKALFLVNSRSGRRRRDNLRALIDASWTTEHEILDCGPVEDLDGIIERAVTDHVEVVFAVGGDGTVHEVAKRLRDTPMALAILPTGSGNGIALHLGIPTDTRLALEACRNGSIVTIDMAEVNGTPFVGVMGLGLDAAIAHGFAGSTSRGLRTYVTEGLRAFSSLKPAHYSIEIDGKREERRAVVVAVANSSQYGNNARISPLASLQDGLLDVVIVENVSLVAAPLLLARLFTGTIDRSNLVTITQAREVTIRRASAGQAHLDGEPVMLPAELRVTVHPRALRVLAPSATTRI